MSRVARILVVREVELTRSATDRSRYELEGLGWLRSSGLLRPRTEAGVTGGQHWTFVPRGWTGGRAEALDGVSGLPVGDYRRTGKLSYAGTVTWHSRSYDLASTSRWRQRFAVSLGEHPLVELDVKGRAKRPVTLRIASSVESEPGLVLFACWLCQRFTTQASSGGA